MKRLTFSLLFFYFCTLTSFAQINNENGYPQIRNYAPKEYGGDIQNWAIAQDKKGIMYFGNNLGLLEYDGETWKLNKIPNASVIRSIAIAEDGKIYVGGVGDFGYFFPDSLGELKFYSLVPYLKSEYKKFSDIWTTHILDEEVIFSSINYLFKWSVKNKHISIIKTESEKSFHAEFTVNQTYYVRPWGVGLLKMEGD